MYYSYTMITFVMQLEINIKTSLMKRIDDGYMPGKPAKFNYRDKNNRDSSFRSKIQNVERMVSEDRTHELSFYEFKIMHLFDVQKGQCQDESVEHIIENQTLRIPISKYPLLFPKRQYYYDAVNSLIERGFMIKIKGNQSSYLVNPAIKDACTSKQRKMYAYSQIQLQFKIR